MKLKSSESFLCVFPRITMAAFFIAIIIGLLGTVLPSLGYLPAIGSHTFSFEPWATFFSHPSLPKALKATIVTGVGASIFSLLLAVSICSLSYGTGFWNFLEKLLASILSIPHAAFAIGFGFLIAPSGWIFRMVSPGLTGFTSPPDWIIVKDPNGFCLMTALVIKETPFLILMIIGALQQIKVKETIGVGRSLGYHPFVIWLKLLIPQIFPRIRLSVYAIIAYSLSVVDIALILGPTTPPTLAVLVLRWFNDPDLSLRLMGAVGATVLLLLVALFIISAGLFERISGVVLKSWLTNGTRTSYLSNLKIISHSVISVILMMISLSLLVLMIWSLTWQWRFPDAWPMQWTFRFWEKGFHTTLRPLLTTLTTGAAASLIAIVLVIGCLEYERVIEKTGRKTGFRKILRLIYLPLLVPQIAFLFGIQIFLVFLHSDGLWVSLVWSHLIFVLPYVFLTLSATYRSYDDRYSIIAATLSQSRLRPFYRIKLPILLRPILFSFAVGFSVSVAQYLPTLFIGAGRFITITTETVNLAGGSDRRIVAVYAMFQQLLPYLIFTFAIFLPKMIYRNREGMRA